MPKGISVHVGVNRNEVPGLNLAKLEGCVNDALAMHDIAEARGFTAEPPIVDGDAKRERVIQAISDAAGALVDGDIFLFTFSGHGTRRGAQGFDEADLKDETLVLFDKLLIDNVLRRELWPMFAAGVRIVMVSDSCHSGTITAGLARSRRTRRGAVSQNGSNGWQIRGISEEETRNHVELLADFYANVRSNLPQEPPPLNASLLLLAACRDPETTLDGNPRGAFTQALLNVWNADNTKTYQQLIEGIRQEINRPGQNPVLAALGPEPGFAEQQAFSISG